MNSIAIGVVIVPGVVALLLFLVFTYLYEQSRQAYFRAWQLGWAAYTLHFALDAWGIFRGYTAVTVISHFIAIGGNGDLHLGLHPTDAQAVRVTATREISASLV